jgi:hypothetical protein
MAERLEAQKFSLDKPYDEYDLEVRASKDAVKVLEDNSDKVLPIIHDYIDKMLDFEYGHYYEATTQFQISDGMGEHLYTFMLSMTDDLTKIILLQTNLYDNDPELMGSVEEKVIKNAHKMILLKDKITDILVSNKKYNKREVVQ